MQGPLLPAAATGIPSLQRCPLPLTALSVPPHACLQLTYMEPMIKRSFLMSKPDECWSIPGVWVWALAWVRGGASDPQTATQMCMAAAVTGRGCAADGRLRGVKSLKPLLILWDSLCSLLQTRPASGPLPATSPPPTASCPPTRA